MAKQIINVGISPNSRTGDTLRTAFTKINDNFQEVYDNLATLNGSADPSAVVDLNIKGSVYALDGSIVIDSSTGKISPTAIPASFPTRYQFIARFDNNGDLTSIDTVPTGWAYTISDNLLTLSTGVLRPPSTISYWGYQDNGELRIRYPTPGYQATCKPNDEFKISLFLTATVTGATVDQYAYVIIVF